MKSRRRVRFALRKPGAYNTPHEIDEALLQHPSVLEAAAVGVPDALADVA